ncbi:MAG TPA: hypothetical protein VLA66_04875 [Thermoanaerobaculia bacterium]|nr:hypothetical protein [Thermoanaerobaculia bacterium]
MPLTTLKHRILAPALALGLGLALPVAAAAHDPGESHEDHATLKVHVEGEDGESVHFELGSGWLGALISAVDIECDAEGDAETRRMMKSLREQGEGGFYRFEDDDGDDVVARRRKGQLRIETREEDGERAVVEMPWEVAECLLLGVDPPGDLGRRIAAGEAATKSDVRDGDGRVRISLD